MALSIEELHNSIGLAVTNPPDVALTYHKYLANSWNQDFIYLAAEDRTVGGNVDIQTLGWVGRSWSGVIASESIAERDALMAQLGGEGDDAVLLLIEPGGESFAVVGTVTGTVVMRNNNKKKTNIPVRFTWIGKPA